MSGKEGIGGLFHEALFTTKIAEYIGDNAKGNLIIKGLYGSSKGFVLSSSILKSSKSKVSIVVEDSRESAEILCVDLYSLFGSEEDVFYFPTSDASASKIKTIRDSSNKVQRSLTISAINNFLESGDRSIIVVTYPEAVKEKILNSVSIKKSILKIKKGDTLSFDFIKELLMDSGFERVDYVAEPGQFAVRGSIVDIFSYSDNVPYRIDFFGNEVESLKRFDINTQRSVSEAEQLEVFPNIYEKGRILAEGGEEFFDFIKDDSCVVWNDTFENLSGLYKDKQVISLNGKSMFGKDERYSTINLNFSPQPSFNKNFTLLAEDIRKRNSEGYKVFLACSSPEQAQRLTAIFRESEEISSQSFPKFEVLDFALGTGFVSPDIKVCLYTDHQIFNRHRRVKVRKEVERSERLTIEELNSFHIGDYVVHIDHGVGVFGGLLKTNIDNKLQEAVKIMYKDGDVIFVSVHSLHKIAKYKSKDGIPPKIYKLGNGAWSKLKNQTKAKIKDIAKELIDLYAKRRQTDGYAFSPDNYMQNELEASFMYEDTPDQSAASKAVKADMEASHPMDRLVCGDVGFGKTEVAIRAAFKAVCDNKQVAVLVPTTILALQHFKTFSERLKDFPVNIDYISRLRTAKEIKDITDRLKNGKLDIVIGTHRILNKKVEFKDLGLLIIDEEQKFGVAAKERLRQLKVEVDTLTLTATPIPRTLQFSLLGARDLSIINTPPPNRLPVQTEIIDFNEDLVKEAIEYELNRGGQVFFVHDRVEDILSVEQMLNRICPEARTVVGHGQMEAKVLENKMLEFINGEYDILVATSIIENGIDIPNANTIIINSAQNFGLSDLHQLRGRVGRSNMQAFCYLIVPPLSSLTEDAKRRINAIEAFSELGSGFNIAMQDLDIRGAGNMLGGEQSGFIADMGFETYQRILNEAFVEINSEMGRNISAKETPQLPVTFLTDSTIDTDLQLFIPDEYVSQTAEKIRLYKELDNLKSEEEIKKFLAGLEDRFGPIPEQIIQLTYVVRLRRLAIKLGFEKVIVKNGLMLLYFISNKESAYYTTDTFSHILQFIADRPEWSLKDNGDKLWIVIRNVRSINDGYRILEKFQ
ncbi:MAG: transcription-repair coupling factor [Candidatus Egerieousia sp.]